MNKLSVFAVTALSAAVILAQDAPRAPHAREGGEPRPPRQALAPNSGIWVAKMLSSPNALERIGVTDEAVREKVSARLSELNAQGAEIEKKIRTLSLEQAKLFKEVLADKAADGAPLMAKVGEIAALRAEQGRLSVSAILFLRDTLPQDQLDKAVKLIDERGRERGQMRGPSPFDGERRRDRDGEGARRHSGKRGGGDRPGEGPREGRRHSKGMGDIPPVPPADEAEPPAEE